jgi:hypothetical protein
VVQEVVKKNRVSWEDRKYAYISLFGINSIEEFRESIFVEMESNKKIKGFTKTASEFLDGVGTLGDASARLIKLSTKIWMHKAIPGSKICVDDMERRGNDLSIRDLFGFLLQLKEQHQCQIILVLNEDELAEDAKEFDRYREKVVDQEIEFVPQVDEIIKIGFGESHTSNTQVLGQINVDNIRAVKKTKQFLERIAPFIVDLDDEAKVEVNRSAIVLGWFYFTRDKQSIPWDFVKSFDSQEWFYERLLGRQKDKELSEEESKKVKQKESYATRLRECNYLQTGPLEKLLVESLEKGFQDNDQLSEVLKDINAKARKSKAYKQLEEAWNIYYSSFDNNEQAFVDALVTCFKRDGMYLEVAQLDEVIFILKDLGYVEKANEAYDEFFKFPRTFDSRYSSVYGSMLAPKDARVRAKVDQLIRETAYETDLKQIVHNMIANSGWNPNDMEILQAQSEEAWYHFFKEQLRGDINLRFFISRVLDFRRYSGSEYSKMTLEVEKALVRIASESKINKLRISGFNLDVHENT